MNSLNFDDLLDIRVRYTTAKLNDDALGLHQAQRDAYDLAANAGDGVSKPPLLLDAPGLAQAWDKGREISQWQAALAPDSVELRQAVREVHLDPDAWLHASQRKDAAFGSEGPAQHLSSVRTILENAPDTVRQLLAASMQQSEHANLYGPASNATSIEIVGKGSRWVSADHPVLGTENFRTDELQRLPTNLTLEGAKSHVDKVFSEQVWAEKYGLDSALAPKDDGYAWSLKAIRVLDQDGRLLARADTGLEGGVWMDERRLDAAEIVALSTKAKAIEAKGLDEIRWDTAGAERRFEVDAIRDRIRIAENTERRELAFEQATRAQAGKTYEGQIVSANKDWVLQQDLGSNTLVAHARQALSGDLSNLVEKTVQIRYPHGNSGLVTDMAREHGRQHGLEAQRDMQRHNTGREMER